MNTFLKSIRSWETVGTATTIHNIFPLSAWNIVKDRLSHVTLFSFVGAGIWTALVGFSLVWNFHLEHARTRELVTNVARSHFDRNTAFRFWAASHGGVYVPVDERTRPNPNLQHVPERDIETPSGKKLTLMNPAYMLRQLMNEYPGLYGTRGRITSLKPLNPDNAPDTWEKKALLAFENGQDEMTDRMIIDGAAHYRLMRPLEVKKSCLKCHASQGYEPGDIRGGVGVIVPMQPFLAMEETILRGMTISHGGFWLLGLLLIGLIAHHHNHHLAERRKNEVKLKKSEAHFRAVTHSSSDAIISTDDAGGILFCNPSAASMFGYGNERMIGRSILQLFSQSDHHLLNFGRHRHGLEIFDADHPVIELKGCHKEGRTFPLELSIGSWNGNGRDGPFYSMVMRDITERKQIETDLRLTTERAESASRAKSDFLASMSHEIRTPMNTILGIGELLGETRLSALQQRYVSTINRSGGLLLSLINNILDISKIEEGKLTLERTVFDARQTVEEVMELFAFVARDKGIRFKHQIDQGVPKWVRGDPTRLHQVLMNLVGNAVKFTQVGQVGVRMESGGGDRVFFAVSDTGPGIPEKVRREIFRPFAQADSSTTRTHGGTGLGLAICRRLVELMGGEIELESEPGQGSRFTFTVLLPGAGEPEDVGLDRRKHGLTATTASSPPIEKLNILLVDDAAENREVIEAYLQSTPCHLEMAENGAEAVETFKKGRFDLVLMDIRMPIMDGYRATETIRRWESDHGLEPTPIVALTANALREDLERARRAGCDQLLTKPLPKANLMTVLRQYHHRERTIYPPMAAAVPVVDPTPDSGPGDNGRVINMKTFNVLHRDLQGRVHTTLQIFLDSLPEQLNAIINAFQHRDADRMAETAHKLCGSASILGVERLAAICRELELAGDAGRIPDDGRIPSLLLKEGQHARTELREMMRKNGAIVTMMPG